MAAVIKPVGDRRLLWIRKVQLYLNSITIRQAPTLRDRIDIAASCGYSGLELWMHEVAPLELTQADIEEVESRYGATAEPDGFGVAEIRAHTDRLGLGVAGLCPATHAAANWHDNGRDRSVDLSLRRTIEICAELGGQYVIVPMLGEDADLIQTAESLSELAEHAADQCVSIGFEPVGHVGSFARLEQAMEVLDRAGYPDNTGLILDLFHFFRAGQELEALSAVDPDRILVVHLNNAMNLPREQLFGQRHRTHIDKGIWDGPGFLNALKHVGYDGRFAVEILNDEYWSMPAADVAAASYQATTKTLREAGFGEADERKRTGETSHG